MDRGVRKAGAATDKDRRRILVCDITVHWERMEKDYLSCLKGKRVLPTKSLHAWWFAQDGSEPGSGAGARGGGVVAWGGGVGL